MSAGETEDHPHETERAVDSEIHRQHSVVALAARGVAIGVAEAIPGVSGGTVALILGVYARLIDAISAYKPSTILAFLRTLPGAMSAEGRPAFVAAAKGLHLDFLIPVAIGMLPAMLIGVRILPGLIENYRAPMHGIFFGMILISTYVPWAMIKNKSGIHLVGVGIGAVAAYVAVGFIFAIPSSLPVLFGAGAVAVCALILPGVSGSYVLKATGQYTIVSHALKELDIVTVGVFLAGMVVGITIFVRILSWLLHHHAGATLSVLTGLMFGSLRSVWPFQRESGEFMQVKGEAVAILENFVPASLGGPEVIVFVAFLGGGATVLALLWADRNMASQNG